MCTDEDEIYQMVRVWWKDKMTLCIGWNGEKYRLIGDI
ncbi:hypothetical protein SAMN04488121_109173 [Chitinophaga filiformis]|uniref:Uncharacterized protein n=1 Tax=Chitinophaga filiformis TaxID=104663 RepID=A0A1G8A9G2_CHIFI|nr:hypothetical protein SAMN04488121_109173 [Chitinophaga filiformis]